jgi:hypothetical protein
MEPELQNQIDQMMKQNRSARVAPKAKGNTTVTAVVVGITAVLSSIGGPAGYNAIHPRQPTPGELNMREQVRSIEATVNKLASSQEVMAATLTAHLDTNRRTEDQATGRMTRIDVRDDNQDKIIASMSILCASVENNTKNLRDQMTIVQADIKKILEKK